MATRPTTKKSEDSAATATTTMTPPTADDVAEHAAVEFTTTIRGRSVTCRWEAGGLSGDQELLDRLARVPLRDGWNDDPCAVASAIGAAVAHPVTIRLLDAD
jgi:hypothetical protein